MKTHLLSVRGTREDCGRYPCINTIADWLPEIGFINGALLQVLPEQNGLVFNLCNENIQSYSELDFETKEKGGRLIQMGMARNRGVKRSMLSVAGRCVRDGGLAIGDKLVARYEYGIIRIRKLPSAPNMKVIKVSQKSQVSGKLLAAAGFSSGDVATAKIKQGEIIVNRCENSVAQYSELVKFVRQNGLKLIQVGKENYSPVIFFPLSYLEKSGAELDDIFTAHFENEVVKLQKLNFGELGF